jgi:hypothetical protein
MIYAIVGKPGVGKSMLLTRMTRKFLNEGVDVYTNIPTDEREWALHQRHGKLFYLQDIEEIRKVDNGVIIIDELNFYFEATDWAKFDPEDRMKFQRHRHERLDIYYSVQNFARANNVIRQLTNEVWVLKKFWLNLKIFKRPPLNLFWSVSKFDADEYERSVRPRRLNRHPIFYPWDFSVANAYNTTQWAKKYDYQFKKMAELFIDKKQKKRENKNTQT